MPIYDQSYAHWEGRIEGRTLRWLPIMKNALRLAFRSKVFLVVFCLAVIPFVIWAGVATIYYNFGPAAADIGRSMQDLFIRYMLGQFFQYTTFGIILLALFAGCGLIARDLKVKALEIYFSKPITLFDYLAGKLAMMIFLMFCVTLFPGIILYLLDYLLSPDTTGFLQHGAILGGLVLHSLLLSVTVSMIVLAISALCSSARVAAIVWFGFHLGLMITGWVLWQVFNMHFLALLDVRVAFRFLGQVALGIDREITFPWGYVLLYIFVLNAGSALILYRRVRRGEGDAS